MSWLEQELKAAMKRREPPAGFADRVAAQASRQDVIRSRPGWRWIVPLAACLVLMVSLSAYRAERQRREAERVKAELGLAMQITADKLEFVRAQLSKVTARGEI